VNALSLAAGIAILVGVVLDVLATTLREGAGPGTRLLTRASWRAALALHRRVRSHRLLVVLGVGVVLLAVVFWIAGLWLGWVLVFWAEPEAVVRYATGEPASLEERAYFAATTLLTLGPGDFVPRAEGWRAATALASLSGLFVVTFAVTYLVPIVRAAAHKRQVAVFVASLGQSPIGLLLRSWNGRRFTSFERVLERMTWELAQVEQSHLSYPVLHYLHSATRTRSMALSVASVDEALTILELGFDEGVRCDPGVLSQARASLESLIDTLGPPPGGDVPPPPPLEPLRRQGVPVTDDATFEARVERVAARRRRLRGLVEMDGWEWEQVLRSRRERERGGTA
jgi:hypothetical protein